MTVRSTKIEIYGFSPERKAAWRELAISCQRMTNRLWQVWLCHHLTNGTPNKLRAFLEARDRWKSGLQEKPAADFACLEPPLGKSADPNSFYRILSAEFSNVSAQTRVLLEKAWKTRILKRKAASGPLPGWESILLCNEALPSFTRPLPIPFDKANATLIKDGEEFFVELRIERLHEEGSRRCPCVVERCELMLRKRKSAGILAIIRRCISGEYAWKGSNLLYDRGKWYAVICYEMPKRDRATVDPNKTMFVRAGRSAPWRIKISGESGSFSFGGNGQHVNLARRKIDIERGQRQQHYRWAGSAQKGRGRRRAEATWTKLSSRWKDFVKRYNNEVSRRIVDLAVRRGCGRIVYMQPTGVVRDTRYLSTAGSDHQTKTTWDYFAFGSMLAAKSEHEGVEYGVQKKAAKPTTGRVSGVRKHRNENNQANSGKTASAMRSM